MKIEKLKTHKLTKNLWLHEYIPEKLYKNYANRKPHYLMNCLDPRLIKLDQEMRNKFGPVVINNWIDGELRNWSGLRTEESPYYSFFSQHSWGRASDKIFIKMESEEVREDLIKNYKYFWQFKGLTCIEANVSWVHSDCRALLNSQDLLIVYPK